MLDILLVIALILFALNGRRRGLILSVLSIVGYLVSLIVARTFSPQVSEFIISNTGLDTWMDNLLGGQIRNTVGLNISTTTMTGFATKAIIGMICFFIIFTLASMIMSRIIRFINRAGRLPLIGGMNRLGGLIFGLAKGLLLTFVVLALASLVINTGNVKLAQGVENTILIKFMYENNPIVYFISDMFQTAKNTLSSYN